MSGFVTVAVVGAGNRGSTYARHAVESGRGRVVAVAEPDDRRRQLLAEEHGIDRRRAFDSWEALVGEPPIADAVVIATQDTDHAEPAVALARHGYNVLLEKPMATTEADAAEIVEAARDAGIVLTVCHVLRYTPYARRLRGVLDSGLLGDIVTVEHLEPVGWWHQAHSYVRGSWRKEAESSPMILAKSVHDLDWLNHIIRQPPLRVASFGGLHHFRPERRPEGAADNCLDCAVEPTCPYSAPRLYLSCLGDPERERWPLSTITDSRTPAGVLHALRSSRYGRCVYSGDNDVVDHQVVAIEYEVGTTATFTMTGFTPVRARQTRICGSHGFLEGDGRLIHVTDFRSGDLHTIGGAGDETATEASGHGGGDRGIVDAFLEAIALGDSSALASPEESLESHRLAWAAERARHQQRVIEITPARAVAATAASNEPTR
jgi:predicted dehydrogenase